MVWRIAVCITLTVASLSFPGCHQPNEQVVDRVANDEAAQDPKGTIELFQENVLLDENDGLHLQLEQATRYVNQDPENRRAYAIRSMILAQLERDDDRFRDLTTAIVPLSTNPIREPMLCEAYYARGLTFQAMEEDKLAVADFNNVLKMENAHAGALQARAYSYLRMSELDLAINDSNQAVKLTPDDPEAYELRSRIRRASGDHEGAESDLLEYKKRLRQKQDPGR